MSTAPLTARGTRTRATLLEAAERVFESVDHHESSIVKITVQTGVDLGTFYRYFAGRQEIFDEFAEDLNRRVPHAMAESSSAESTRIAAERAGFLAFFHLLASIRPCYNDEYVARLAAKIPALEVHRIEATNHYTIVMAEAGANTVAGFIQALL